MSASKSKMPGYPRKYAVHELLAMRLTLRVVCCPITKFTPDAWTYGIIRIYQANPSKRDVNPYNRHSHQVQHHSSMDGQRRGGPQPTGIPVVSTPQMFPTPIQGGSGEFRRYVSNPVPNPAGQIPQSLDPMVVGMDPLRQGILRNVARFYPQAASNYSRMSPLMSPAILFPTYPPASPMPMRGLTDGVGGIQLDNPAHSPISQHSMAPNDLSGGYPAVTIGAAGYSKGQASQGFVPGGSLKTVPVTGLTPNLEKNEPDWAAQSAIFSEPAQYDPNNWVQSVNRSAFPVFDDSAPLTEQERRFESILANQAKMNDSHAVDKGKGKEVLPAVAEELPSPPPPMLGTSSAREHQLAFIEFMKKNLPRSQRLKENMSSGPAAGLEAGAPGFSGGDAADSSKTAW